MSDNPAAGFSTALQVWKGELSLSPPVDPGSQLTSGDGHAEIDLHSLQKTLDKQGLEIVENQKDNLVGRKKLAEQTRGQSYLACLPHLALDADIPVMQSSRKLPKRTRHPHSSLSSKVSPTYLRRLPRLGDSANPLPCPRPAQLTSKRLTR